MRTRPDFYSPGQLSVIVKHCNFMPEWLLLGGPADGNEAQTAQVFWPKCRVLAFEPNPEAWEFQVRTNPMWSDPELGDVLDPRALSDQEGSELEIVYEPGLLRNASADPASLEGNRGREDVRYFRTMTTTLDAADRDHGPVQNAVLWLDVEGHELDAVKGARGLFDRGAIRLVNVEVQTRRPGKNVELTRLLDGWIFRKVKTWNNSKSCEDQIWVRDRERP